MRNFGFPPKPTKPPQPTTFAEVVVLIGLLAICSLPFIGAFYAITWIGGKLWPTK